MDKNSALRLIAEKAYDVGYSAKLHFATHDIVEKAPGWIGLISTIVGILSLFIEWLAEKQMSAAITILGVSGLYITFYSDKKGDYFKAGQQLTALFNRLKKLSLECKSSQAITDEHLRELEIIEEEFNSACLSKHIFGASWLAHKKFFWEHQIGWINEQLKFKLFRDKIPFSLYVAISPILFMAISIAAQKIDLIALMQRTCM